MNRPPRRMIIRLIVLLALGAAINIAVTWGCALFSMSIYHQWGCEFNGNDADFLETMRKIDCCPISLKACAEEYEWFDCQWARGIGVLEVVFFVHGGEVGHFACAGWPLISFHGIDRDPSGNRLRDLWSGDVPSATHDRLVPLRPIWPGFTINMLFYAAILWLIFVAPFAMRRRLRLRRSLCPSCAYPIGGSDVCTECGHQLPRPTGASPS